MEHANLRALYEPLPFVYRDLTSRDFGHANGDEAHEPDIRVIGLNEDQRAGCDLSDVGLRIIRARCVEAVRRSFGKVRSVLHVDLLDCTADRAVPTVIAQRT